MERLVKVWKVGRISYSKGLALQNYLASLHLTKDEPNNVLLCVEHDPVYTIGIRTKQYSDEEAIKLIQKGAEFYKTDRGGLITFHGPGQLVVYPILNLKHFNTNIRCYVSKIESTVIDMCKEFSLKAETSPHTGVWIGNDKICAIGIRASRYISTHGLALNCSTDLSWFNHITPCGIDGKGVTSISKEVGRIVTIDDAIPKFVDSFSNIFNCRVISFSNDDTKKILEDMAVEKIGYKDDKKSYVI
ncbi:lipoyl(octanoyl) transferase 2 [Leptinotarsa decemlineata]|uniref:lipoyl(octanoyl) transferase 2 n=1 Tax=Leptinotarsa decemlineata TaxID=7539 RepID=UPI003D306AE3